MIVLSLTNNNEASASICDTQKKIIFAASEERFNRKKNFSGMPINSINFLLNKLNISLNKVDKIIYCSHESIYPSKKILVQIKNEIKELNSYDKKVFKKRLKTEIKFNRKHINIFKKWIKSKNIDRAKIFYMDHHEAHARSAIICQKRKSGHIITADGKGGFTSSAIWKFKNKNLTCISRNSTFNSLGYLYGNITIGLGYKAERHEGKITGLSSYGKNISKMCINNIFSVKKKKIIARNIKKKFIPFFLRGRNNWDVSLFRKELKKFTSKDVAATAQNVLEKIFVKYIKINVPKTSNLLLSGGIFANVKLNRKIKEINTYRYLFVTPPMSDCGLCLGGIHKFIRNNHIIKNMYLGPEFSNYEIIKELKKKKIKFEIFKNEDEINQIIFKKLNKKKLVGVFNGKMEFGPRALCNRSIIFSAKYKGVNNIVNKRLNRTEFMPFAPVCLDKFSFRNFKNFKRWDDLAKFMTITYKCSKKFTIDYPAACHVDKTARPQILYKNDNFWFYKFLDGFNKATGETCLMNTSFNNHEEPIVCKPKDAINSLINNNVDYIIFNKNILACKI